MSKRISICIGLLAVTFMSAPVMASEAEDLASGTQCLPAKKIVKMARKFDGMKPERVDTVQTVAAMRLKANDGGALPAHIFFRTDKEQTQFALDEDGNVVDFQKIGGLSKKGELCLQDPRFVDKTREDTKGNFALSLDFNVAFKNTSGSHSLAELIDGTKDGKSHYKKMFPGPLAIMVPKMTHVGVGGKGVDGGAPLISAYKNEAVLTGLTIGDFGGMQVISVEELQALGADSLKISSVDYSLTPIPSIEKMKSLGFGPDGEGEGGSDD